MKKFLLLASVIGILIVCCIPKAEQIIDTDFIDKDLLILKCKDDMSFIFDTGANETILYSDTIPCDNMINITQILNRYEMNESYINEKLFKNITFTDLSSKRLIGLPFFKRFSAIYINTKKKQIECWI